MKKFLATLLIVCSLFFMSAAQAEVETYTGEGKATMSEAETQEQIIERAKTYALRNAREKAGVYIRTRSELRDFELVEDDIITMTAGVLKITDTQIEKTLVNDAVQVFVTITVIIDSDELKRNIDDFIDSHGNIHAKNIPADAVKYEHNGHSYKIIDTGLTWNDAKTYCESLGGHLVTITSGVEQAFVQDLIINRGTKGYYWTGGIRDSDGNFVWITGEKFSYSNWYKGEPNNGGKYGENVLTIYRHPGFNGFWNDMVESGGDGVLPFYNLENSGFVCEWDA